MERRICRFANFIRNSYSYNSFRIIRTSYGFLKKEKYCHINIELDSTAFDFAIILI